MDDRVRTGLGLELDRAQVAVVGGGIVGVCTAYFLSEKGYDVVLLEREHLAFGASGRNAGIQWLRTRTKGLALDLARLGVRIMEDLVSELGSTFELDRSGGMFYFLTDAQRRVFHEFADARARDGVKIEVLDEGQARALCPMLPAGAIGATFCAEDGQVRTPFFIEQLGRLLLRRGVRIHEHTPAVRLLYDGEGVRGVQTADGVVRAEQVVWATGSWSSQLESDGLKVPIIPERRAVLLTVPVPDRMNVCIHSPRGARKYAMVQELPSFDPADFADEVAPIDMGCAGIDLARQRADGRLLIGDPEDRHDSLVSYKTSIQSLKLMVDGLLRAWPELAHICVEDFWSCLIPTTADSLPIIDAIDEIPGLYLSGGHIFGNVGGPSTGQVLAELVAGESTAVALDDAAWDRPSLALPTTVEVGAW
jgi:glycine/D-amino acid oxidase-like deaminating enzyme